MKNQPYNFYVYITLLWLHTNNDTFPKWCFCFVQTGSLNIFIGQFIKAKPREKQRRFTCASCKPSPFTSCKSRARKLCTGISVILFYQKTTHTKKSLDVRTTYKNCPPCEKPIALYPFCNLVSLAMMSQAIWICLLTFKRNPFVVSCETRKVLFKLLEKLLEEQWFGKLSAKSEWIWLMH